MAVTIQKMTGGARHGEYLMRSIRTVGDVVRLIEAGPRTEAGMNMTW